MAKITSTASTSSKKFSYDVLPDGDYESRLVRFVGLGVQKQDPFKDPATGELKPKKPAFKAAISFELVADSNGNRPMATGKILEADANGVMQETGIIDPRPACQFKDYFINPRAKNSGMLDLMKMVDPTITALSDDLDWYREVLMDAVFSITVGHYTNKHGQVKNKIVAINPIPARYRSGVASATLAPIFFEPYTDNEEMLSIYNNDLYPFQRNDIAGAIDATSIPYAGREAVRDEKGEETNPIGDKPSTSSEPNIATEDDDAPF